MANERRTLMNGRRHALSLLGIALGMTPGLPVPRHIGELFQPIRKDGGGRDGNGEHTGDVCPKCQSRRVWISGETLRCRDCGTRFIPDDLPPNDSAESKP